MSDTLGTTAALIAVIVLPLLSLALSLALASRRQERRHLWQRYGRQGRMYEGKALD